MAKMTAVQSKDVKAQCASAGCTPDECNQVEAALGGIDWTNIPWASVMQLVMQLITIFRPKP